MSPFNPRYAVRYNEAVRNIVIIIRSAQTLVSHRTRTSAETKLREYFSACALDAQHRIPVRHSCHTFADAVIVQPVKADNKMINYARADYFVVAKPQVVSEVGIEEIRIQRRRKTRIPIQNFLIAA